MMSQEVPASMPPFSATPPSGRLRATRVRWLGCAIACAGTVGLGSSFLHRRAQHRLSDRKQSNRRGFRMSHGMITAICGGLAESASLVAAYPLETIKVRCQMSGLSGTHVFRHLVADSGGNILRIVGSLYAGVTPAALTAMAMGAAYLSIFSFSETMVTKAERAVSKNKAGVHSSVGSEWRESSELAAGVSSGVASLVIACIELPVEMTRLRLQSGAYTGGFGCLVQGVLRDVMASGALIYLAPCLVKEIPQDMTEFVAYGKLTRVWDQSMPRSADDSPGSEWMIGAGAGAAAAIVSLPADVLKTRLSCVSPAELRGGPLGFIQSYGFAARTVYQECGVMGFFAGFGPRLVNKVPQAMIYWVAIESARRILTKHFASEDDDESSTNSSSR